MSHTSRVVLSAIFIAVLFGQLGRAELAAVSGATAQTSQATQQEILYAEGTRAMDEQRWSDAVTAFDRVAAAKGERSDASLYWKAYSLNKLGRTDESRVTCDSLSKQQPSSRWNRECFTLQMRSTVDVNELTRFAQRTAQMNLQLENMNSPMGPITTAGAPGLFIQANHPADEDDIKILALNSLMRQDPSKALPVLKDLVKSDKPISTRKQALFVLSRSKDPQAQALLMEIATTKGDPQMQAAAVERLWLSGNKDVSQTLISVYRGSTDAKVRRAAINGLFLSHDAPGLVDLARGEKDLNMKIEIVSQLSMMKDKAATDYMVELLK